MARFRRNAFKIGSGQDVTSIMDDRIQLGSKMSNYGLRGFFGEHCYAAPAYMSESLAFSIIMNYWRHVPLAKLSNVFIRKPHSNMFRYVEGFACVAQVSSEKELQSNLGLCSKTAIRGTNLSVVTFASSSSSAIRKIYFIESFPTPYIVVHYSRNMNNITVIEECKALSMEGALKFLLSGTYCFTPPVLFSHQLLNYCYVIRSSSIRYDVRIGEQDLNFSTSIPIWKSVVLSKTKWEKGIFFPTANLRNEEGVVLRSYTKQHPSLPLILIVYYVTDCDNVYKVISQSVLVQYLIFGDLCDDNLLILLTNKHMH